MRARRLGLIATAWFMALAAVPALAQQGGNPEPRTWLNWVTGLQIGGVPLAEHPGVLALAWSLVAAVVLGTFSILGTRRLSVRTRSRWSWAGCALSS